MKKNDNYYKKNELKCRDNKVIWCQIMACGTKIWHYDHFLSSHNSIQILSTVYWYFTTLKIELKPAQTLKHKRMYNICRMMYILVLSEGALTGLGLARDKKTGTRIAKKTRAKPWLEKMHLNAFKLSTMAGEKFEI